MYQEYLVYEKGMSVKLTDVVLHDYIVKNGKFIEQLTPNLKDGKRHKIRGFIIAHDDNPYPNATELKALINIPTKSHSNIENSIDFGNKLSGFCITCKDMVKSECKNKFGGTW